MIGKAGECLGEGDEAGVWRLSRQVGSEARVAHGVGGSLIWQR